MLNLSNSAALQFSTVVVPTSGLVFDQGVSGYAFVVGNLSGSGNLALQNNAGTPVPIALTVGGNNGSPEYLGVLSGAGSLTLAGNGTLTLANTSTYSGLTTVASGALQFGDGTAGHDGLLSGTGGIVNNSAVIFNLYGSEAFGGAISGSGSLTTSGTGLLTLTGTSSFSGGTTISAGTLQLGDGTAGHDALLSGSGGITNNGWLVSNVASSQIIGTFISGTGSLTKVGSGILTLATANYYTGSTTISAGTLQLGDGTPPDDGMLSGIGGVVDNGVFSFKLAGTQVYADVISGAGSLLKTGTGRLTLAGTGNSFSGGTTVSGGVLEVTNPGALPGFGSGSTVVVGSSGTLVLSMGGSGAWTTGNLGSLLAANGGAFASGSVLGVDTGGGTSGVSYASAISGSMGLTKIGANVLTLTASNTYSGGTVISGRTLQLGTGTSGSDGSVSAAGGIADGSSLVFDLYASQTYAGSISGLGNLIKLGSGSILTLAGSNTFSGTTTIGGGTLELSGSAALLGSTLISPPAGSLIFDHGVAGHAFMLGGLSGSNSISLQDNGGSAVALGVGGNGGSTLYSGVFSGSGSLNKIGSGTMTLTAAETYTGGTTVSGGMLQLGDGLSGRDGSLLSGGTIADNATLSFDLYGSQTYSGIISGSGSVLVAAGSVTLSPGASLITSAGNVHVGQNTGARLTVTNSSSISIGNELDVNYQATASGSASTAYLNLQGGTVSVAGPVTVGHARMDTITTDTSAVVNQSGGLLTAGGPMTIGLFGVAQSIYNASGGQLTGSGGLTVGAQGNGVLNISGSGNVAVAGTGGLSIGGEPTGATGGTVNLSGGTLAIGGDTILGNEGIGTLVRTGGVLTGSGNLVAAGAGTLVFNGSAVSVATHFSGHLSEEGTGTLIVVPYNNQLSGSEALTFGQSSTLTDGIFGAWTVRETSGTSSAGDYLTLSYTNGSYSVGTAAYSGTLGTSTSASVVSVAGATTISSTSSASAYAVKFGGGSATTVNGELTLAGGGIILNGGTLNGGGAVNFAGDGIPVTGFVFAGSTTASAIGAGLTTTRGLVKFGPGTLVLSGLNSGLEGGILASAGVLSAQGNYSLGEGGSGNDVLVAAGAELDLQNNINLPAVEVSLSGTGVGNAGGLHNTSGTNSLGGVLNLTNNLQIGVDSGSLSLLGPIQGSYNLTKTGSGTLALTADASFGFSGNVAVANGTLDVSNSGALGSAGGGALTTVGTGATLSVHGGITLPQSLVLSGSGLGNAGALENSQNDNNAVSGSIQLAAATQISVNAGSLTIYGPISGNYGFTKTGSGMLALSAVNTFSGPLAVTAGTISVPSMSNGGSAGPIGSSTTAVALGASGGTTTFDYNGFGDTSNRGFAIAGTAVFQVDYPGSVLTLGGPISGSGSLVQAGYGVLTINGSASYGGSTTVSQGELAIGPGGSLGNTSSITVCPGTLLQLTSTGSEQLSASTSVSLQGGGLSFYGNASTSSGGEIAGNLLLGAGENDISLGASTSGTYQPYLKFAGFPAPHAIGATLVVSASGAQLQFSGSASLTNGILGYAFYNGTDFATLTGGTLSGGTVTGGTVAAYSAYTTGNLGTLSAASSMNVEPSGLQTSVTAAMTINSLNLDSANGVQMSGSAALTLGSGGLIANTSGGIRGGTLKGSASGELTIYAAQNIPVSSTIPNNGGPTALVISGPGTVTLSGSTTYSGDTYLNNNSGGLALIPPGNETYAGAIHGPGNLSKSGSSTLTLSGTSDFSGSTTIAGGGLCVNGLLSADSEVTLQSSAILFGSGTIGGGVTSTGGTVAMSPAGSILGGVSIGSGTLTVGSAGVGNYLTTPGGLYVTDGASLIVSPSAVIVGSVTIASSANSSFSGVVSGSGSLLTFDGAAGATLTLGGSASSTFGGVVIQGGTLRFATTAALGNNPLTVNGGTVDVAGLAGVPVASLAGSGGVILTSSGSSAIVIDSPSGTISDYSGSIINGSGLVSLSKEGAGELILAGSDSYTGGTLVTDGTLAIASPEALPAGGSLVVGSDAASIIDSFASPIISPDSSRSFLPERTLQGASPVPEPGTLVLLLAASLWSAAACRRFSKRPASILKPQVSGLKSCE